MLKPHALRVVQRSSRSRALHRFLCLCFAYVGPQGFGSCCEQLTLYLCRARSCRALVSCLDTADMARDDRGGLTVLTDAMRLVEGEDDGEEPAAAGATRVVPVRRNVYLVPGSIFDLSGQWKRGAIESKDTSAETIRLRNSAPTWFASPAAAPAPPRPLRALQRRAQRCNAAAKATIEGLARLDDAESARGNEKRQFSHQKGARRQTRGQPRSHPRRFDAKQPTRRRAKLRARSTHHPVDSNRFGRPRGTPRRRP